MAILRKGSIVVTSVGIPKYQTHKFLTIRDSRVQELPEAKNLNDLVIAVETHTGLCPVFIKREIKYIAVKWNWDQFRGKLDVYSSRPLRRGSYREHGYYIEDLISPYNTDRQNQGCRHTDWNKITLITSVVENCAHCGIGKEEL